jgi:hypothetical protein
MSRRDYIALAGAIRAEAGSSVAHKIASNVAHVLAADNPRFDRQRFLSAALGGSDSDTQRTFPVLSTSRLEVAASVIGDEDHDTLDLMVEDDLRSNPLATRILDCDDATFEHIVSKAADLLMEGGCYFEALACAAELVLGQ